MCLAMPGKIEKIEGKKAKVDFRGVKRTVDLSFLEDGKSGDWVLVHVGFAIQKIDKESAQETYRLLDHLNKQEKEEERL